MEFVPIWVLETVAIFAVCILIFAPLAAHTHHGVWAIVLVTIGGTGFWQTVFSGGLLFVTFNQSRISLRQAKLSEAQNSLILKQHIASHPPLFSIKNLRVVSTAQDENINVNYSLANVGHSSARIVAGRAYLEIGGVVNYTAPYHGGRNSIGPAEYPPGYEVGAAAYQYRPIKTADISALADSKPEPKFLYFWCSILFEDEAQLKHVVAFRYKLDNSERRFIRCD